jgi:hypothetical protein
MGSFNTYVTATLIPSGIQSITIMAAAYESRATQIARLFVPIASFAGDTAQTLTDGSFNSFSPTGAYDPNDPTQGPILPSSTAILAGPSNIQQAGNDTQAIIGGAAGTDGTDPDALINGVTAKPLIVKVRRNPLTGEITGYGVFNADGSVPGFNRTAANQPLYTPGQDGDPFESVVNGAAFAGQPPRYKVNRMTGEIYLNNRAGIVGVNLDAAPNAEIVTGPQGTNNIVGIAEFKALEGAALSTAQQKASELSNVIQSLATLIRGYKERERSTLNVIR